MLLRDEKEKKAYADGLDYFARLCDGGLCV